jgi:hypothetical protein
MPSVTRGFADRARATLASLAIQYAARAGIAVVFAIAVGFAIAAIAVMLIDRFGSIVACWIMTGGLVVLGIAAVILIRVKERADEARQREAIKEETRAVATDAATHAPLLLAGSVLSTHAGASAALTFTRLLGRNLSLVALLALVGGLLWPTRTGDERLERRHWQQEPNERYLRSRT